MKLKSVKFINNVRIPNCAPSSYASLSTTRQKLDYIELQEDLIVIHKQHLSTLVPLSNVAHCETLEEPAINQLPIRRKESPESSRHGEETKQGQGTKPAKAKKGRKKASIL